jgi:hypothetical protein
MTYALLALWPITISGIVHAPGSLIRVYRLRMALKPVAVGRAVPNDDPTAEAVELGLLAMHFRRAHNWARGRRLTWTTC